jgi:hypothetical protein
MKKKIWSCQFGDMEEKKCAIFVSDGNLCTKTNTSLLNTCTSVYSSPLHQQIALRPFPSLTNGCSFVGFSACGEVKDLKTTAP